MVGLHRCVCTHIINEMQTKVIFAKAPANTDLPGSLLIFISLWLPGCKLCVKTGKGELEVNSQSHLYGLCGAFIWLRIPWETLLGVCFTCLLPFSLTLRKRQILTDGLRLFLEVKIETAQTPFCNNQA